MNLKSIKFKSVFSAAVLVFLLANVAWAGPKAQVNLKGKNDADIDRSAIQDAIDSAPGKSLTIKLSGTFQLDGLDIIVDRSDLVIKGVRGGATLLGKLGEDGQPIDDFDNFPNRGFLVESVNPLTNIEIKDLALSGFRTPVFIRGQENEISDVRVKNHHIENSFFGVTAIGAASDVLIANNSVIDATNTGVSVFGTSAGRPTDIHIVDNHITGAVSNGILIINLSDTVISNNYLATSPSAFDGVPLFVDGTNSNVLVDSNTTQGGAIGMVLWGDSTGFMLTRNCIRDGGTQGLSFLRGGGIQVGGFGFPSSGFDIADNSYAGNLAGDPGIQRDVWLDFSSSNTSVTERSSVIVLDEGASNSVAVLPEDGVDHCLD
ncbi:MAG TPA: right-handed parallel beta-helix repeat-containing protein [Xanthomonadales bacterium]|nr:right-handed parallel beta-helix repeat-containing protein [Xanthomonadales bacterium]